VGSGEVQKIVVQKEQTMTTYLEGKCSLVQEAIDTGAVGAYPDALSEYKCIHVKELTML
jgi:hypothetical protein